MKKVYLAHEKNNKNYQVFENYTRKELTTNDYIIDGTLTEDEYNNLFNGNEDRVIEHFANNCDLNSKRFKESLWYLERHLMDYWK